MVSSRLLPDNVLQRETGYFSALNSSPQLTVSTGAESMETRICCVYNATRGCRLSSTVAVVDSAREPLKVLKVLVEGLARDGKSGLWLTPLAFAPSIMRLFPFDFAYLNSDLTVREAVALLPGIALPRFIAGVAGALILPLDTFSSIGTCAGDRLIICEEAELEAQLLGIARETGVAPTISEPVVLTAAEPVFDPPSLQVPEPVILNPTRVTAIAQGTGFTLAMSTSWQVTNSTGTAAAVLRELIEPTKQDASEAQAVADTVVVEEPESPIEPGSDSVADAVPNSSPNGDFTVELTEFEPTEEMSCAAPSMAEIVTSSAGAHLETPEAKAVAEETSVPAEEPLILVSDIPAEAAAIAEPATVQTEIGTGGTEVLRQTENRAEAEPATIASLGHTDSATTKKNQEKKKESLGVLVKRFLNCEDPLPERRSIIRLVSQGLVAYTGDRAKTTPCEIRDVSPDGLYVRTDERWPAGTVVSIVIERKGAQTTDFERRAGVQVRVVRCETGGVGLEWVWPEGVQFQPWKRVHTKRSDETDADFFLRELRLAAALGFLRQICPSALEEIRMALHQRLSNKRVASAVEIALKAQEMPGRREAGSDLPAHPDMVRRILENGSWTEDNWIRQWWAGLLASSCSPDGLDTSNSVFIDMLARLTPAHLRLLSFICRKGTGSTAGGEPAATPDVYCTAEQVIEAVGSHSLGRIQQTMGQLSSVGLIAENSKPSYVEITDKGKTKIAPTALALKMYARCNGLR